MGRFDTFVARDVFSELNGFVLANPTALDRLHEGAARDADLLTLYATTALGQAVVDAGAAVPVMDLETNDYTLVVRLADAPSPLDEPGRLVATGWLHVDEAPLRLCGAGYLARWNPDHPKVHRVNVPAGAYDVEVLAFTPAERDWMLEFVLRTR